MDDLWTPTEQLPERSVLNAIADRCGGVWGVPRLPRHVSIVYNPRLRTAAGRAMLEDNRVELNPHLLREHPEHLIPTLVHELAHAAVHMRFGRVQPHGAHWQALMRAVGLAPKVTHKLPAAHLRRRRRRYLYLHRCIDCGYSFIARSVRRNTYCRACGPTMTWDVWRAPNSPQGRGLLDSMAAGEGVNQ